MPPDPHPRPTLEVVAARAGVSRATASRVLRDASNVSAAARAAVHRAIDETGYTPNLAARSLVTRRSGTVAFVVAESKDRLFGDPYFLTMLRGAQAELAVGGTQLIFVILSSDSEAAQFTRYAGGGHVDGVLLVSLHGDDSLPLHLESIGVPAVLNGRPLTNADKLFYVDSDNLGGARAATELLIERGCTNIATITGPMDMAVGLDRLAGFQAALSAASMPLTKAQVATGDFSFESGARAMVELLSARRDVDGVFAASDLMALGALSVLHERGVRVPDDVAILGFDDIREAAVAQPALTTIRQPTQDVGRLMARTLLRRLDGESPNPTVVLPVTLVRRVSA